MYSRHFIVISHNIYIFRCGIHKINDSSKQFLLLQCAFIVARKIKCNVSRLSIFSPSSLYGTDEVSRRRNPIVTVE